MKARFTSVVSTIRRSPGYLIIAGILACALLRAIPRRQPSIPDHTYQPGSVAFTELWEVRTPMFYLPSPVVDDRAIYVPRHSDPADVLVAIDADTGQDVWVQDQESASKHRALRSIIAADGFLYAISAKELVAYDARTGNELWATELHADYAEIIPAVLGDEIIVYYGDELIRIPRATGEPVQNRPLGSLLWLLPHLEIRTSPSGMIGITPGLAHALWLSPDAAFDLRDGQPPIPASPHGLLVPSRRALCVLKLDTGRYSWCLERPFISNAAVGGTPERAFVLDDEFSLLSIDLASGEYEVAASYPGGILPADTNSRYPYFVVASSSRLFVYFGDSLQMFSAVIK
jgi:hypothetical protein